MSILITFLNKAIIQGVVILYGCLGEILTEKGGNLNLGIPGLMYIGGISGLSAAVIYEKAAEHPVAFVGFMIALIAAVLISALGALIYSFLTITLKANQNVVGLTLTTFGVGFGNFIGGSISRLSGGVGQVSVATTASAFQHPIPFLCNIPVVGKLLFSYGFLTYFSIILAFAMSFFLRKTRGGLNLRAIGENPGAADAAAINIEKYKYIATIVGGIIAGLGGLFFVMEYLGGTWQNNVFGDRGWLAVALVIFSLWDSRKAILGAFLFGALCIVYMYIPNLSRAMQELFKMAQYVITIIVLIISSIKNKRENQGPESLGLSYFREDR